MVESSVVENDRLLSALNLRVLTHLSVLCSGETVVQHKSTVWHSGKVAIYLERTLHICVQYLAYL